MAGRSDQVSSMRNERRREQRPEPVPGDNDVPLYYVRASFANKQNIADEVRG
jgi:hypothetical protein